MTLFVFSSNKLSARTCSRLTSLFQSQCRALGATSSFPFFFRSYIRVGVFFFCVCQRQRYTRVRVLFHWICNENVLGEIARFFFFYYGFCISSHASRSLPPSFFFEKVWTFQVKDVIFEDYTASASWKETCRVCRYLQYFFKIFVEIVSLFFIREKSWYNIWKIYINRLNYEKWSKILWTYNIFLRDSYRNNILFQDIYGINDKIIYVMRYLMLMSVFFFVYACWILFCVYLY